jgi:hypothetical protein
MNTHTLTGSSPTLDWLAADHLAGRPHRPLRLLALAMAVSTLGCLAGLLVDHRELVGLDVWDKPLKFSISVLIYAVTWSWLIDRLRRFRRLAWWAGTIAAAGLAGEMVIIIGQTVRGQTSHFNTTTPLNAALWNAMAMMIAAVWIASLVVCVLLFGNPSPDRARTWAIRSGAVLSVIGMILGVLMTIPSAAQRASGSDIVGAHTVGLPDGGPGLPILGWSTVGGDLRIPHFVGMHALQALPLFLIALELLSPRVPRLADERTRLGLVRVFSVSYLALVALILGQALRGQSVVHPDQWTLLAGLLLVAGALSGGLAVLTRKPSLIGQ